jgi:hypothetical protein
VHRGEPSCERWIGGHECEHLRAGQPADDGHELVVAVDRGRVIVRVGRVAAGRDSIDGAHARTVGSHPSRAQRIPLRFGVPVLGLRSAQLRLERLHLLRRRGIAVEQLQPQA